MKISAKKSLPIAVAFCALSAITAVHAETRNTEYESVRVSFADLDLEQSEGLKALEMRVRGAAQQVCGVVYSKSATDIRNNRECRNNAVYSALRQVGLQDDLAVVVHKP